MSKTFTVVIDGTTYEMHKFNIGQLRKLAKLSESEDKVDVGFQIFAMAMSRATPPVEDIDALEVSQKEFQDVMATIMRESGMEGAPAGEAKPGAEGQA